MVLVINTLKTQLRELGGGYGVARGWLCFVVSSGKQGQRSGGVRAYAKDLGKLEPFRILDAHEPHAATVCVRWWVSGHKAHAAVCVRVMCLCVCAWFVRAFF